MKYIVCQVQKDGKPFVNVPFIFPDIMVHSMVFSQMRALLELQYVSSTAVTTVIPLSAGELSSTTFDSDHTCFGESTSLKIESRLGEDSNLLAMCDYGSCLSSALS